MDQSIKKLYYSISEVSEMTGLKPYVLRYWETEFKQLAPPKNRAGNRTYRQKDIDLILTLKQLLHVEKFTIEGARKRLAEKPVQEEMSETTEPVADQKPAVEQPQTAPPEDGEYCEEEANRRKKILRHIRTELEAILEVLQR